ncbi:MAG TPA: hypothetical protein DIC53_11530 [Synergistaceae bacterium]|jgi:gas vesicle protein|nr:hypothetical protein [Synergistaceae bacterium]
MKLDKVLIFAVGVVVGVGAVKMMKSKPGRRAVVSIAHKGYELKDLVNGMAERVKESLDDVVAEAKVFLRDQKENLKDTADEFKDKAEDFKECLEEQDCKA